jgi:hypothetical protein
MEHPGPKNSVAAGPIFIPISYSVKAVLEGGASVTKQKKMRRWQRARAYHMKKIISR